MDASTQVRARVEDKGRVDLNDGEMKLLDRTKQVHVALIVASLLVGVALQGSTSRTYLPNAPRELRLRAERAPRADTHPHHWAAFRESASGASLFG